MARQRAYNTNAERQKAYRDRIKSHRQPAAKIRNSRPLSRPKRLAVIMSETEDLHRSYTEWLESLPENLQAGYQAGKLQETIDTLAQVIELMSGIGPPKGFGRD